MVQILREATQKYVIEKNMLRIWGSHCLHQLFVISQKGRMHPYAQLLCGGHFQSIPSDAAQDFLITSDHLYRRNQLFAEAEQTTILTLNQINAARQQEAAAHAQVDAELLTAHPNLPSPPPRPNQQSVSLFMQLVVEE